MRLEKGAIRGVIIIRQEQKAVHVALLIAQNGLIAVEVHEVHKFQLIPLQKSTRLNPEL